jgi:ketosteroid isomerase-like protein
VTWRTSQNCGGGPVPDLALEAGDFDEVLTPVDGSEPVLVEGRYAFVWQRQGGGEWRITRFMTLDRMTGN